MGRYYNNYYNYDDIKLWDDAAWESRGVPMQPLVTELIQLSKEKQIAEGTFGIDRYADRHDEIQPVPARNPFFRDVVDYWKERGMQFVSVGMVSLAMVPMSVINREKHDPKILIIPVCGANRGPHWTMNAIAPYHDVIMRAAQEEVFLVFMVTPGGGFGGGLQEYGTEAEGIFKISFRPVYMDLSLLKAAGKTLADVPGINEEDYSPAEELIGLPVVDVSEKWQSHKAHQYSINNMYTRMPYDPKSTVNQQGIPGYDDGMHRHSTAGRIQGESMHLEMDYDHPEDPRLLEKWDKLGLKYESHYTEEGYWVTMTPKCCFDRPDEKIPVLICMKEPRVGIQCQMLTAMQFYYPFIDIAANGECILLFFAMEMPDDNDVLEDILQKAAEGYPIDMTRVYITGQSHNGSFALEFARRHPETITAVATLCNTFAINPTTVVTYDDSIADSFRGMDMPCIDICGELENKMLTGEYMGEYHRLQAHCFLRRMKGWRCKEYTEQEIMDARKSEDYVTRRNGVPADRTEVQYCMGTEMYISDYENDEGKWHLRLVSIENTPHMIMPQMGEISWSFLRRFARDKETHKIIERY